MSSFDFKKLTDKEFLTKAAKQAADKLEETSKTIRSKTAEYTAEKLNEFTGDQTASQKVKEKYQAFEEVRQDAAKKASKVADSVAEKTAAKVNKVTGLNTTPEEVKKAATVAALAVYATGAMEVMAGEGLTDVNEVSNSATEISDGGETQYFEDEANEFFADKGGLNIKTNVVDMDGCILDSGE